MKNNDEILYSAPRTNRGVQNTEIDVIKHQKSLYSSLNIDFFTCTLKEHTIDEVLNFFGYDFNTAILLENRQLFGYKKCYLIKTKIFIYFDNERNKDIMLWLSGKSCREVYYYYNWKELLSFISLHDCYNYKTGEFIRNFNISRIDLATDFYNLNYNLIDKVKKEFKKGNYTTKFKSRVVFEKYDNFDNDFLGNSVRCGSMSSDISIIFYDKKLERDYADYDVSDQVKSWFRMEVNYRDNHAMRVYEELIKDYDNIAKFNCEVINNYLSFKRFNKKDSNKSRWFSAKWWLNLLSVTGKQKLTDYTVNSSIMKKRVWLKQSSSKSLVMCFVSDNDFLKNILSYGLEKLKYSDYYMIKEHLLERYKDENISMYQFIENMDILDIKENCVSLINEFIKK